GVGRQLRTSSSSSNWGVRQNPTAQERCVSPPTKPVTDPKNLNELRSSPDRRTWKPAQTPNPKPDPNAEPEREPSQTNGATRNRRVPTPNTTEPERQRCCQKPTGTDTEYAGRKSVVFLLPR